MKTVSKLDINSLTLDQKLGMLEAGYLSKNVTKENKEYTCKIH